MSDITNKKYPFHVLESKEQLEVLYKFFQMKEANIDLLEKKIAKLLLPAGGLLQTGLDYPQFINKIAQRRNIILPLTGTTPEKERLLFQEISQQNLKDMPEKERLQLQQKLVAEAQEKGLSKSQIVSISSLVTIGGAQLSGFGVYLLASSTVGAVTSLVGITLPFAFYTGMSSVISVAIGPIGLLLAAIPLYKTFKHVKSWNDAKELGNSLLLGFKTFTKGNYELAEIIFSYFASLRILRLEEYEIRLKKAFDDLQTHQSKIDKQQLEIDEKNLASQNTFSEIEVLKEKIDTLQTLLKEQQHIARSVGNVLSQIKKEKLRTQDNIHSIKNAQKKLLN